MNRWIVTDRLRDKFEPVLKEYFNKVENITAEQVASATNEELAIDFTGTEISPYQLTNLLKEFGYKVKNQDNNGWELDFWISMSRADGKHFDSGCENMVVEGCGMTFELRLYIDGMDF